MNSTEQQILKAVALIDNGLFAGWGDFNMQRCPFCKSFTRRTIPDPDFEIVHILYTHKEDCPVITARSLLKESMGTVKFFSVYFEENLAVYRKDRNTRIAEPWLEFNEQAVRDQWKQCFKDNKRNLIVKELCEV